MIETNKEAEREGREALAQGLLSSQNPYDRKDQLVLWVSWDTGWHVAALELPKRVFVAGTLVSTHYEQAAHGKTEI